MPRRLVGGCVCNSGWDVPRDIHAYQRPYDPPTPTPQKINNNQQGDEARAREALQEMRRGHNIEPDAISYTTCIQACGRVRFFLEVEGLI